MIFSGRVPRRSGRGPVARTLSCPGRRFGRSWRIFAYSTSSNFGLVLGRVDENMRQDGHPVAEPLVDVLGDVLGPVGADVVAEGHPGSDDHALRAQVNRAQFDNLVDTLGGPDLFRDHPLLVRVDGVADQAVPAVLAEPV